MVYVMKVELDNGGTIFRYEIHERDLDYRVSRAKKSYPDVRFIGFKPQGTLDDDFVEVK